MPSKEGGGMRKRIWLLASCGIVGAGLGLAAADAPPTRLTDDVATSSLTDPISTSPKDDSKNASPVGTNALAQAPASASADKTPAAGTVVTAEQAAVEAPEASPAPSKAPKLIHAEYHTRAGSAERAKVRLVGGTAEASPFDDPVEPDTKIDRPAAPPSAPPTATKPFRAAAAQSAAAAIATGGTAPLDGLDAAKAPVVTLQWVKKSALERGPGLRVRPGRQERGKMRCQGCVG